MREFQSAKPADHVMAAEALKSLGVKPKNHLASIGLKFDIAANCAHCAGARVVVEISDEDTHWHLSAQELTNVSDPLAGSGITALVAFDRPIDAAGTGWLDVSI